MGRLAATALRRGTQCIALPVQRLKFDGHIEVSQPVKNFPRFVLIYVSEPNHEYVVLLILWHDVPRVN